MEADEKLLIDKIKVANALGGIVAVGVGFCVSLNVGISVLLGWTLMAFNFEIIGWQIRRMLRRGIRGKSKASIFLKYYLRYLALVFIIWLIVDLNLVQPLAFGLGLLVLGLSFVGVAGEMFIKIVLRREG